MSGKHPKKVEGGGGGAKAEVVPEGGFKVLGPAELGKMGMAE